ncbi:hypothetical protein HDU98_003713, partial [Podochytrium sp. JEL0797]
SHKPYCRPANALKRGDLVRVHGMAKGHDGNPSKQALNGNIFQLDTLNSRNGEWGLCKFGYDPIESKMLDCHPDLSFVYDDTFSICLGVQHLHRVMTCEQLADIIASGSGAVVCN